MFLFRSHIDPNADMCDPIVPIVNATNADSRPPMLYWKLVLSCPTRVTLHDLWALLPPSTICQQEIVAQNLVPNLASGWLAETVGRNLQLMFEIELFNF